MPEETFFEDFETYFQDVKERDDLKNFPEYLKKEIERVAFEAWKAGVASHGEKVAE